MLLVPHVVGKHLMTRTELTILIIVGVTILTIFGIGANNAFGEATFYEPKFKFPMPAADNIDTILEQCGVKSMSDIKMHVQCNFIVGFGDDGMEWYIELIDKFGLSAEDKERKDLGLEDQPPIIKDEYSADLEKLQEIIDNPDRELSAAEEEYYALITTYAECTRGYDQSRRIHTE